MSEAGKEQRQFVKQRREERYSQFVNSTLPAIKSLGYEVIQRNDYGFEFIVPKKGFGWVIFYPRVIGYYCANKINGYMVVSLGFANIYLKAMEVCKTDVQTIIRLLDKSAELIDKYCKKPCECDKARQCRKISKKLKNKIDNENFANQ